MFKKIIATFTCAFFVEMTKGMSNSINDIMYDLKIQRSEHSSFRPVSTESYWKYTKKLEKSTIVTCSNSLNETLGEFEGLMWGPMSHLKIHKVDEFMCGYDYIGEEYNPIGRDIF